MRIRLPSLLLVLLGLSLLVPTRLLAQDHPYSATVPVIDTSDAQRDHAFTVALGEVLGQVANKDLSAKAGYTDALGAAPSYVQQFQYSRAPADAAAPYTLTVKFDPSAIRHLVASMGAPTWSGPDAPVLLLVRGAHGGLLDANALTPLTQALENRDIKSRVAGADAPDTTALATADPQALSTVAQRYHTGLILLGTLGNGNAVWTLVSAGNVTHWTDQASDADAQLDDAGNTLIQHLMQQFSATSGGGGNSTLWISGVDSGTDFAKLLGLLRNNSAIRSADVSQAQGDGVLLDVTTRSALTSVVNNLGAGGHLLPAATAHGGADASLRWLP